MKTEFGFETSLGEGIEWHSVREERFDLYGLIVKDGDQFRRIPQDVADATNDGVSSLSRNTAGGRVRFITDSPFIALRAEMPAVADMAHFSRTGSSSFDLYLKCGERFYFNMGFYPTFEDWGFEVKKPFGIPGEREVLMHFPTYSDVAELYIGLAPGSVLKNGTPYKYKTPVVYYGSSITQGACASRPGNAYEAIIANEYDCDHINLGFSGSARAEDAIVDYVCSLDMSVFVMDYDHNAPNSEYLEKTHEPFFKKFRAAHPDTPVIFVTRPTFFSDFGVSDIPALLDRRKCREIIFRTYMNALDSGDLNVDFIDGASLFNGPYSDLCTVDTIHPNDAGFLRMAMKIGQSVGQFLK